MDRERLSEIPTDSNGEPLLAMVRIVANREKKIPKEYEHLIPSQDTPILTLLRTPLPTISSAASILPPAESCVVCDPPNCSEEQLKTMQVPLRGWLAALDTAIVNGWLKGICSIKHPSDAKIRFPLWVGTFWTALLEVIEEQRVWKHAEEWVCSSLTQGSETRQLQAVLCRIPWKVGLWMLPVEADRLVTKVSFFAKLLSDGFLAERHVDAFVAHLNVQARRMKPNAPGVLVAGLLLANSLSLHCDAPAARFNSHTVFLQYGAVFKQKKAYQVLLFPAHVGGAKNGHWIAFRVDFARCEYSYGEKDGI
jgi:hypothetical protein